MKISVDFPYLCASHPFYKEALDEIVGSYWNEVVFFQAKVFLLPNEDFYH